ncbi:MAG TPA: acylphosphatase [Sumerlaeia bacterium]|nr:acylphosphatase [Sumerlaeia bacterium]
MPRAHAIVSGMVQGVGFRYYALREAERAGVSGWVRNRRDGAVELEAQGEEEALEAFLAAVRRGPAFSVVRRMDVTPIPESERSGGFDVRF